QGGGSGAGAGADAPSNEAIEAEIWGWFGADTPSTSSGQAGRGEGVGGGLSTIMAGNAGLDSVGVGEAPHAGGLSQEIGVCVNPAAGIENDNFAAALPTPNAVGLLPDASQNSPHVSTLGGGAGVSTVALAERLSRVAAGRAILDILREGNRLVASHIQTAVSSNVRSSSGAAGWALGSDATLKDEETLEVGEN
ncbi:unnamed protein product, partial [Choristocarpus tenellus]